MEEIVFLNGRFVPYAQAVTHVEDRSNVFADGVYEVVRYYGGRPFEMDAHMARLEASARAIRLPLPMTPQEIAAAGTRLVQENGLQEAELYIQVSRGVAPRSHAFPAHAQPTVFMTARPPEEVDEATRRAGVSCITVEDRRWKLCHVKSVMLLANVLAKQEAKEAGAFEAILVRDGIVTEGSTCNVFAVSGKRLLTHPTGPYILSGVTRKVVLELAARLRIPVEETPFTVSEMKEADEVFLTSTSIEVLPVTRIDGATVGKGVPGPVTLDLYEAFVQRKKRA